MKSAEDDRDITENNVPSRPPAGLGGFAGGFQGALTPPAPCGEKRSECLFCESRRDEGEGEKAGGGGGSLALKRLQPLHTAEREDGEA